MLKVSSVVGTALLFHKQLVCLRLVGLLKDYYACAHSLESCFDYKVKNICFSSFFFKEKTKFQAFSCFVVTHQFQRRKRKRVSIASFLY